MSRHEGYGEDGVALYVQLDGTVGRIAFDGALARLVRQAGQGEHRRCPERNIRADELDTSVFEQIRKTLLCRKLLLAGEHAVSARREPVADELLQAQLAKL